MKSVLVELPGGAWRGAGGDASTLREGKFVRILAGRSVEFLVLGDGRRYGYHADVVEAFCSGDGRMLAGHRERGRHEIDEPGWSVAGGGRFLLDGERRSLVLYGRSIAYGRFDGTGLAERLSALPLLAGWTVTVSP